MLRPLRLLLCASTAALILGAVPVGGFDVPAHAQIDVTVSAPIAPPLLPIYAQPPIPGPGYLWVPGYWAWDGTEYYWVPGYWEQPPTIGYYWTPGYWAWDNADNDYVFYAGYWGPTVGYYGGIDYGFGYTGEGYHGGYWRNDQFYYNRGVNNLGTTHVASFFNQVPPPTSHVSFNGGNGGTTVRPTEAQLALARGRRMGPTAEQVRHQEAASRIASLRYNANHGHPPIAAVARANEFHGAHIAGAAAIGAAAGGAAAAHLAHGQRPPAAAQRGAAELAHAGTHPQGPAEARHLAHAGPAMHGPAAGNLAYRGHAAHGPAMARNFERHAPAMHGPATHGPAMARNFAHPAPMMHGPAMHQNFANRAPQMHMSQMHMGAPNFARAHMGPMNAGGMHFGGGPHMAGGPHFGGAPHMGAGPHFGGAPHMGAGPHIGGGPHMGGGPGGHRVP